MAKGLHFVKKNKHILVENGAAFLGLMIVLVVMVLSFVYFLVYVQIMNDEGVFMYSDQHNINKQLSDVSVLPQLEEIWKKEASEYEENYEFLDVFNTVFDIADKYGFVEPSAITAELLDSMSDEDRQEYAKNYYYWVVSTFEAEDDNQGDSGIKGPVYVCRYGNEFRVILNGDREKTMAVGTVIKDMTGGILDLSKYVVSDEDMSANYMLSKMVSFCDDRGESCFGIVTRPMLKQANGYLLTYVNSSAVSGRPLKYVNRLLQRIILLMVIAAAAYMILFYRITVRPLRAVKNGLQEFTASRDADKLVEDMKKIRSRNEIGRLTDDISDMAVKLKEYEKVVQEQAKAATELALASEIQISMLPDRFPDASSEKRFDLYASMKPAKEVGGDLYDFFFVDEDHLVLEVGDVSGKGVPAALFMMMVKTMVKDKASLGKKPGELIREVNEELIESNRAAQFITIGYMVVELSTGNVTEVNAGHMNPVVFRAGGSYEMIKSPHSMVVGIMEDMEYEETSWKLGPGDRIFIYSDGVTEAENSLGEQFGNDKLVDILNEVSDRSQKEVLEHVGKAVSEFAAGADQSDDITMLGFTYYGTAKE